MFKFFGSGFKSRRLHQKNLIKRGNIMSTVIVTVVVTLGIIIAGGFLIYFLGDLFMSLASHGKKDDEAIKGKSKRDKQKVQSVLAEKYPEDAEKIENDPDYAAVVLSGGKVESYDPNEDQKAEGVEEPEVDHEIEEPSEEVEPAVESAEEIDEEQAERERIEKRRQEILERINRLSQEMQDESEESEAEEEVDLTEEPSEEENAEETEETEQTEETDEISETEETEKEEESIEGEEETPVESTEVDAGVIGYTVSELEEMLASEREELKANEKELRKCKKEFIPLRRVKKTLERDEKKLRRKEVLVAKQKVELYGVNNIADIDEEKAKKLSEDLDLYDGLKLSVQHCQEVMEKNAERYPLLEQIFNLLTARNGELKSSNESHEKMLAQLNGTNTDGEGE